MDIYHRQLQAFKILSWNVAGLRGLLKKQPNALPDLAAKHDIDLLCLQETKLQEMHVLDPKLKIKEILDKAGFDSHYSCSTVKKGYSGTATYIKRRNTNSDNAHGSAKSDEKPKKKQAALGAFFPAKTETETDTPVTGSATSLGDININHLVPVNVSFTMGDKDHDGEGRIIALDFPQFTIMNCYVPNAGSKLERLAYRTEQWDKTLLQFMQDKEKERGVPVIWLGDLNVAHKAYDVWNDGAKHLAKQPGVTQEERDSFQMQLDADGGAYVDAFRYLFPDAKGHYTFWSQRAGNRPPNKGLRLDYFICSKALFLDEKKQKVLVRDSYMLPEQDGSDHCPVVLEIEIRK
jgi:exodeoxyribonuclease III